VIIVPTVTAPEPFRVSFTVPIRCLSRDEWLHKNDVERCVRYMGNEGVNLILTMACGCPFVGIVFQK